MLEKEERIKHARLQQQHDEEQRALKQTVYEMAPEFKEALATQQSQYLQLVGGPNADISNQLDDEEFKARQQAGTDWLARNPKDPRRPRYYNNKTVQGMFRDPSMRPVLPSHRDPSMSQVFEDYVSAKAQRKAAKKQKQREEAEAKKKKPAAKKKQPAKKKKNEPAAKRRELETKKEKEPAAKRREPKKQNPFFRLAAFETRKRKGNGMPSTRMKKKAKVSKQPK
jgi:hypothetical protein